MLISEYQLCLLWQPMNNLNYFNNIVPCGISDKKVTSMDKELGKKISLDEVGEKMKKHLSVLFNMEIVEESNQSASIA